MPITTRHISILLFVTLTFFLVSSIDLLAAPRTEISLFKYRGVQEGHNSGIKFDVFKGILDRKVLNIQREVLQTSSSLVTEMKNLNYLNSIYINYREKDTFKTQVDIEQWIKQQSNTLGVLRGSINSDDNNAYIVFTEFHLGDLQSNFPVNVITVQLPISSTEFGNTQDSHTVVILYALAMDAKRSGLDSSYLALFLRVATNKLADIKRRKGNLPGDLKFIESAVEKIAAELLGGDNDSNE